MHGLTRFDVVSEIVNRASGSLCSFSSKAAVKATREGDLDLILDDL